MCMDILIYVSHKSFMSERGRLNIFFILNYALVKNLIKKVSNPLEKRKFFAQILNNSPPFNQ